ncbi:hypothetical protein [Pendulispora albinea]|uniref:DUF4198 domain-containing protein n=1 Tax=Pendulispora albinea TaxID=2741071 RepID=A0ABZ2M0M3_9BACT
MRRAAFVAFAGMLPATLAFANLPAHAAPQQPAQASHARTAGPTLPLLPSIPRVRVEVARAHIVVTQDVNIPRGSWRSGDLEFFIAFGAPGAPYAFDAHLLAVPDGSLEPVAEERGEPLPTERAIRRPASSNVYLLLGRPQMAGAIVRVRDAELRRALGARNMAALRLRTVLPRPELDPQTGHEVVVRLGTEAGNPLALGRLQVASVEKDVTLEHAEAHLCGKDADPYPLAITLRAGTTGAFVRATPDPKAPSRTNDAPIAPVLAVRHNTDDLCIRFWTHD